jgi:hypothetical protein
MKYITWIALAIALAVPACERGRTPPRDSKKDDPWRAPTQASVAKRKRSFARFHGDESSRLHLELRAPEARIAGTIRVLRADLLVDPLDLAGTRGELRADVATLIVHADKALDRQRFTTEAHNWLDVGASRPEAERTRLRWARFAIRELSELSAPAAHAGRTLTAVPAWEAASLPEASAVAADPDTSVDASPAADLGPSFGPLRAVDLVAVGDLTFHGFKTRASAALTAIFEFSNEPRPGDLPRRILIRTRSPLVVSLKAHDIKARDAHGVALSRDFGLLGTKVASNAQVTMAWVLVHTASPGP